MSSYGEIFASQIASTMPSGSVMHNASTTNGNGTALDVSGFATTVLSLTGDMSGTTTVNFELSADGVNFVSALGMKVGTAETSTSTTATGDFMFNVAGYDLLRARISDHSGSDSVTVKGFTSVLSGPGGVGSGGGGAVSGAVQLLDSAGTNKASIASSGALKVDSSGFTQPISVQSLPLPSGAATAAKQPALGIAGTASSDVLTVQGITSMVPLKVDGSGSTQPVSIASLPLPTGAATAAKQPALGTAGSASSDVITVQGISSMIPLVVDGSGVTQPVSVASLPLPSGAATAAKQPALGTAGSPSSDVITVQGISAMTPLKIDGSGVTQPVSISSLPLPSGAATAAKQPALGSAGSASSDVITVQGIASMTPLQIAASALPLPTGASTAAKQPALGTAGSASSDVITVQGITSMVPLLVDGSGATQPVSVASLPLPSGAATAAKQPALGSAGSPSSDVITVQGISSMTPLKTDGSGVTQPVSISSLPLPSGAATAAKQPALGTAGSASSDVLTVQGIASMTPLQISASSLPLPAGAATAANQPSFGTAGSPATDVLSIQGVTSMTPLKVDVIASVASPQTLQVGTAKTYTGCDTQFTPASTGATDIWAMFGSSTKVVRVLYIGLHYSSSAQGVGTFFLLRRDTQSQAYSGGTFATTTPSKLDTDNASSTVTIRNYTANPSNPLPPSTGRIAVLSTYPHVTGASHLSTSYSPNPDFTLFDYRLVGQPIVLRGANDVLALNCGGTSPTAGTVRVSVRVIFTEEDA